MIGIFWPLKITVFGKLTVVRIEPDLRFIINIAIHARDNGNINNFILECVYNDEIINIPLGIESMDYRNIIKPATEYLRGKDIGPVEVHFEIPILLLSIDKFLLRERLKQTKFKLIIKTRHFPAIKKVQLQLVGDK